MTDEANGDPATALRDQAARCRRLSSSALDAQTLAALSAMASECDAEAARLDGLG